MTFTFSKVFTNETKQNGNIFFGNIFDKAVSSNSFILGLALSVQEIEKLGQGSGSFGRGYSDFLAIYLKNGLDFEFKVKIVKIVKFKSSRFHHFGQFLQTIALKVK